MSIISDHFLNSGYTQLQLSLSKIIFELGALKDRHDWQSLESLTEEMYAIELSGRLREQFKDKEEFAYARGQFDAILETAAQFLNEISTPTERTMRKLPPDRLTVIEALYEKPLSTAKLMEVTGFEKNQLDEILTNLAVLKIVQIFHSMSSLTPAGINAYMRINKGAAA